MADGGVRSLRWRYAWVFSKTKRCARACVCEHENAALYYKAQAARRFWAKTV